MSPRWSGNEPKRALHGKRHYVLFHGTIDDGGETWKCTAITANSTLDNVSPIIPKWNVGRTILVWMRGQYKHNHGQWDTAVVADVLPPMERNK